MIVKGAVFAPAEKFVKFASLPPRAKLRVSNPISLAVIEKDLRKSPELKTSWRGSMVTKPLVEVIEIVRVPITGQSVDME